MNFKLLAVCFGTFAVVTSISVIGDNIRSTVHNLGSTGTAATSPNGGAPNRFDGTEEICVFCHTPHGGDTSAAVPLWNRVLRSPQSYQTYDQLGSTTFDAAMAPVGSVTIACLSCHDGTQAIDTVINQPGSGGYALTGDRMQGTWSGDDQQDGKLRTGIVQNLGTDLTNDHPVGMQFAGGGVSASNPTPAKGQTNDPDFNVVNHRLTLDNRNLWWIDGSQSTNGKRDMKGDVVLYTRSPSQGYPGQSEEEPFVECASCHNPHIAENATFLRISNNASGLCLTCHAK